MPGKLLSRVSTRFHFILFFQHWLSMLDLILSLSPPSLNSSLLEPLMFLESESEGHAIMSDSLRSHGLYCPWNSPGQNTGVGNLSLLQGIFLTQESNWGLLHWRRLLYQLIYQGCPMCLQFSSVTQSCPTLCDPMDYRVHGILQARILEWVTFPFSRGFSQPGDQIQISCIAGGFFTSWATREAQEYWSG